MRVHVCELLRAACECATLLGVGRVRNAKNRESSLTLGERMQHRRLLAEVRGEAAEFAKGLDRGIDPAEAIQRILDNMMTAYEYALSQMFTLPEDEYFTDTMTGKVLNPWVREQERLALQITHIAGKAASLGLAERQVRLQEQQAAIFATVVDAALKAAGIGTDERRQVHEGIAKGLDDIVLAVNSDRVTELAA